MRHARLHGHPVEGDLAPAEERLLHHVALADGDAARADEAVGPSDQGQNLLLQVLGLVPDDARQVGDRSDVAEGPEQRVGVRVPDLAERGGTARLDQLVPGRDHHGPGPRVDEHGGVAGAGQHAQLRSRQPAAGRHDHLAGPHVLPGRPDVRAFGELAQHQDLLALDHAVLDGDDAVGPRRDGGSRGDPDGLAPPDRSLWGTAHGGLADHA